MRMLILGGTAFLGRHLVEVSQRRGHDVTLFNRGRTNSGLFPDVEQLNGDRDGGLAVLNGRQWDAVIDTSGYVPRLVREAAVRVADAVAHYTLVSSLSVYADFKAERPDEHTPLKVLPDPTVEDVTESTYGGLKALCEQAAETAMPGRVLTVRAGQIVGKYDYVGRFAYWLRRLTQDGEVLAPGHPHRPIQLIDAHDLADWMIHMVEDRQTGVYNATGPDHLLTMAQCLDTIRDVTDSGAILTWVGERFLIEHGVEPFNEMPLWLPDASNGIFRMAITRALAAGLTFRPLEQTVKDTLNWLSTLPADRPYETDVLGRDIGMAPEREAELLQRWHEQHA